MGFTSQLLLFLGTLHLQINKNEQAKNYLELSLDIDKNNIIATNNLALVYEKLEKKDKAINLFKRSIEISPNNPETFFSIEKLSIF